MRIPTPVIRLEREFLTTESKSGPHAQFVEGLAYSYTAILNSIIDAHAADPDPGAEEGSLRRLGPQEWEWQTTAYHDRYVWRFGSMVVFATAFHRVLQAAYRDFGVDLPTKCGFAGVTCEADIETRNREMQPILKMRHKLFAHNAYGEPSTRPNNFDTPEILLTSQVAMFAVGRRRSDNAIPFPAIEFRDYRTENGELTFVSDPVFSPMTFDELCTLVGTIIGKWCEMLAVLFEKLHAVPDEHWKASGFIQEIRRTSKPSAYPWMRRPC